MAYGKYGYGTYGHGATTQSPDAATATPHISPHMKALKDALERVVRGSLKDDPNERAIEDGPVPGSATDQG